MLSASLPLPSNLYLVNFWQAIFSPCLSLLADECRLSLAAVQAATPILLEANYYQALKLSQASARLDNIFTHYFAPAELFNTGFDFKQISYIRSQIPRMHAEFFTDSHSFWAVIGITSQLTQVTPRKLAQLSDWLTYLMLKSIAQLQHLTANSNPQFIQWFPYSLSNKDKVNTILLESVLLDNLIKITDFIKPLPANFSQKISNFLLLQQPILTAYQATQPFAILPLNIKSAPTKPPITNHQTKSTKSDSVSATKAVDIFVAPSKRSSSVYKNLQRHWIAFAVGLSALVIGGIGSLVSSPTANSPTANQPALAEAVPHDVAIVRTSPVSAPKHTMVVTKTSSRTKIVDKNKTAIDTKKLTKEAKKRASPSSHINSSQKSKQPNSKTHTPEKAKINKITPQQSTKPSDDD